MTAKRNIYIWAIDTYTAGKQHIIKKQKGL